MVTYGLPLCPIICSTLVLLSISTSIDLGGNTMPTGYFKNNKLTQQTVRLLKSDNFNTTFKDQQDNDVSVTDTNVVMNLGPKIVLLPVTNLSATVLIA